MKSRSRLMLLTGLPAAIPVLVLLSASEPPEPRFRAVELDAKVQIGYGVTTADVDGDGKPDILLVDKHEIVWYRNPGWEKFIMAEKLTQADHVCIAAQDLDGDGKAEVAVGAGWNPGDTVGSGAVFYLAAPRDRTQRWEPVPLPHEPTVHRMRWLKGADGKHVLVVVPLHGRGNRNGEGAGVKVLAYRMPDNPRDAWTLETVDENMHLTHNFDPVHWTAGAGPELVLAGKEGLFQLLRQGGTWTRRQLGGNPPGETSFPGAGEVRAGRLPGGGRLLATVEPMHGTNVAIYIPTAGSAANALWRRSVIDDTLVDGHAVACGDLLGTGSDQVVVGWRAMNRPQTKVGIKLYTPLDPQGNHWRTTLVDDNTMACEDVCLADLDGDGKLDIVAAGRATHNLKVYYNQVAR
jgi:hypothetical protein